MWLIVRDKEHQGTIFMAGKKLNETVLSTMSVICSFLHKKKAPYLFDDYCNLFWKTPPDQLDGMFRKISKDIDRLKNGGVEAWWKMLIKRLKAVDESLLSKEGIPVVEQKLGHSMRKGTITIRRHTEMPKKVMMTL